MTNAETRLDRAPWRPLHTRILLALGIGWALDSFEVQIIGSVLTPLGRDFGLLGPDGAITPGAVSLIWVVWFAGLMTGATAFGWLADRYGRKRLFVATLVMYSIATVVSAFSPTFLVFLLFRFITATGVGGEYSAVTSAIAEFMPTRRRGAATAATMNFWSVGGIVAGLVGIFFLNSVVADQLALGGISLAAWRLCLLAGAAAAVYALIARRAIPESPRWLASQGRRREANVIITQISGIADDHTDLIGAPHRRSLRAQIAELWRNWRPRLLYGMVLEFSGIGRTAVTRLSYGTASISVLLLALAAVAKSPTATLVAFTLCVFSATCAWISAYTTFSELFPTELRATGIGVSVAAGRFGGMIGVVGLSYAVAGLGLVSAFVILAVFFIIGAIAALRWGRRGGVEARGMSLDAVAPPPAAA
jgi:predicted MFS family arabinose efflux permease